MTTTLAISTDWDAYSDALSDVKKDVAYALDKYRKESIDFTIKNLIDGVVKDYFSTLKTKGVITEFEIQSEIVTTTWKELYPHFMQRILAQIAKFLADNGNHLNSVDYEPKLYHHFFPYEAGIAVENKSLKMKGEWYKKTSKHHKSHYEHLEWRQVCEDLWKENPPSADWIMEWLDKNPPKAQYTSKLVTPHSHLDITIRFVLAKSGRSEELNYTLGKNLP
jgi:hypothetical protein